VLAALEEVVGAAAAVVVLAGADALGGDPEQDTRAAAAAARASARIRLPATGETVTGDLGTMPTVAVEVREATTVDRSLVEAMARLVPQLSSTAPPPDAAALQEIVDSPATVLLVASDGDRVVGTLTLVVFRIPTGSRAIIEDVVVDEAARGNGAGEALTRAAVQRAAELGCRTVDLTSRPSRQAANRLYQRLGFEARETNLYRYSS